MRYVTITAGLELIQPISDYDDYIDFDDTLEDLTEARFEDFDDAVDKTIEVMETLLGGIFEDDFELEYFEENPDDLQVQVFNTSGVLIAKGYVRET